MCEKQIKRAAGLSAAVAAAAATAFCLLGGAADPFQLFSWPLTLVAAGLRWLSLSGGAGNAAATAAYILISLIPCGLLLRKLRRGTVCPADILLPVMSAVLFFLLYLFINPAPMYALLLPPEMAGGGLADMQAAIHGCLGLFFLMLPVSWVILLLAGKIRQSDFPLGLKWLRPCLLLMTAVYGFVVVLDSVVEFFQTMGLSGNLFDLAGEQNLTTGLPVMEADTGSNMLVAILLAALTLIPAAFFLRAVLAAGALLDTLQQTPYSTEPAAKAEHLAACARQSVYGFVICGLLDNAVQLYSCRITGGMELSIGLPLTSLALSVAAMLLAGYIREHNELYADSRSII